MREIRRTEPAAQIFRPPAKVCALSRFCPQRRENLRTSRPACGRADKQPFAPAGHGLPAAGAPEKWVSSHMWSGVSIAFLSGSSPLRELCSLRLARRRRAGERAFAPRAVGRINSLSLPLVTVCPPQARRPQVHRRREKTAIPARLAVGQQGRLPHPFTANRRPQVHRRCGGKVENSVEKVEKRGFARLKRARPPPSPGRRGAPSRAFWRRTCLNSGRAV